MGLCNATGLLIGTESHWKPLKTDNLHQHDRYSSTMVAVVLLAIAIVPFIIQPFQICFR